MYTFISSQSSYLSDLRYSFMTGYDARHLVCVCCSNVMLYILGLIYRIAYFVLWVPLRIYSLSH